MWSSGSACLWARARMLQGSAAPLLPEPNSCRVPAVRAGVSLKQKGGVCSQAPQQYNQFLNSWGLPVSRWKGFATHKQFKSPIPELQALILHLVRRVRRCCLPSFCLFSCSLSSSEGQLEMASLVLLNISKMALVQKMQGR